MPILFGRIAVLVHEVEPVAEAAAQVDLFAEHARRLIADGDAPVRRIRRKLDRVVDDAGEPNAYRALPTLKSREHADVSAVSATKLATGGGVRW